MSFRVRAAAVFIPGIVVASAFAVGGSSDKGDQGKRMAFASPELARLDAFIGPWLVTEHHFNADGKLVGTVAGTEEITWVLEGRAIQRRYRTANESRRYEALGTLTWNAVAKRYEGVWFDNVSTGGPTVVSGEWNDDDRAMVFLLTSTRPDGSEAKHKVVERFVDEERRVATTYQLSGDDIVKRLEVEYKRTVPCPSRMGIIMDR